MKRLWYLYLRFSVALTIRAYYRKVEVNGRGKIPRKGALVLGVRHSNALMDPLMSGAFVPRVLHFLVRADVFANRFARWLWSTMNMMPIYRLRDGRNSMGRNQKIFSRCHNILRSGKCVEIFPEGGHSEKHRLEPIKKGAARIAMGALEGMEDQDVHILPVGLNYSDERAFRAKLTVNFGTPISGRKYFQAGDPLAPKALKGLTETLERGLRAQVLDIRKPAVPYETMNHVRESLEVHTHGIAFPRYAYSKHLSESIVQCCHDESDREVLADLARQHTELQKKLRLPLAGLPSQPISRGTIASLLLKNLLFLLLAPIGILLHLPMLLPARNAPRLVKDPMFFGALRFITGMFLTQILYLIYYVVGSLLIGSWLWGLALLGGIVLSGMIGLWGYDAWHDLGLLRRMQKIEKLHVRDSARIRDLQENMKKMVLGE